MKYLGFIAIIIFTASCSGSSDPFGVAGTWTGKITEPDRGRLIQMNLKKNSDSYDVTLYLNNKLIKTNSSRCSLPTGGEMSCGFVDATGVMSLKGSIQAKQYTGSATYRDLVTDDDWVGTFSMSKK